MSQKESRFGASQIWNYSTGNEENSIHHTVFSRNGQEVALSLWDGRVVLLSSHTGRISYEVQFAQKDSIITCSRFHPQDPRIILSSTSTGIVGFLNLPESKVTWTTREPDNSINNCEFNKDGTKFITVGRDGIVRVYDSQKYQVLHKFSHDDSDTPIYHTNRIYGLACDDLSEDIFFTGGWDHSVIMWDLRIGAGIRRFGGPNIAGDSIDIKGGKMLTGSYREKNPLELWDIGSGAIIASSDWGKGDDRCSIYSAKFCKQQNWAVAGGANGKCIISFTTPDLNRSQRLGYFETPVTSTAIAPDGSLLVASSQNGVCYCFSKS